MAKSMKRTATSDLNRDNWDQEDEPEEPGLFKPVAENELKKRDIKVAVRRLRRPPSENKSMFSNFSGFGNINKSVPDAKDAFNFLSKLNGSHSPTNSSITKSPGDKIVENPKPTEENDNLTNLKTLNECLLEWLSKCIKKNPSCVLTPIFRDYEKHLESFKPVSERNEETETIKSSEIKFNFTPTPKSESIKVPTTPQGGNKFESILKNSAPLTASTTSWMSSSPISTSNVFTNLVAQSSTNLAAKPSKSFLSNPSPFSIGAKPLESNSTTDNNEDDEDKVPTNDFKPVTEEDALFSERVKLFVKNDGQFKDRGVGTLYIKETQDAKGNKIHQAVVRADTNIGNVLLNIRISQDIPTKRMGKNNVMIVCLPTSESKPPPVPILLRVKTEEDADKLLDAINKYK